VAFHLGFELPAPPFLDAESDTLTSTEVDILRSQIRKNACVIDSYIQRIDLFVNQEKYPKGVAFVAKLRRRMFLLMEENDTFRRRLWAHFQGKEERQPPVLS
jgi:hypothetical protein